MGGYIGARAGTISATVANVQDVTATDTTPEVTIVNSTHEDTDGGREGKVIFKGQQSGGEETTLAEIQSSHDGTADDQKGDLIFRTNDGSDGASPTEALRIDSSQNIITSKTVDINTANRTLPVLKFTHTNSGFDNFQIGGGTPGVSNAGFTIRDVDASANRLVITSDGHVGLGTSSPTTFSGYQTLHLKSASGHGILLVESGNHSSVTQIITDDNGSTIGSRSNHNLRFTANDTERVRINSNGAMFFCTDFNSTTAGVRLEVDGDSYFTAEGNNGRCIYANRLTSDGTIIEFAKAGTTCGYVGTGNSNDLYIGNEDTGFMFAGGSNAILPTNQTSLRDNAIDFGLSNYRYQDIYATNGTIQTSDEREKQNIASLTDAEMTAAKAISKLFKTFKWKDKVTEKGDNARTHAGVIAQQVETAMSDAGLDAGNYAFFISTTWWETQTEVAAVEANEEKRIEAKDAYTRTDTYHTKDEAPEGATEHTRMGIRYAELLSFVGAATEQRLTSIESRLAALEAE